MIGLPNQTASSFQDSLQKTDEFGFGHISLYILTLEPNTPFHSRYKEGAFPLPEDVSQLYSQMQTYLCKEKGFTQYEISNFARRPDLESKHNKIYWEGDAEFAAFGNGAASFTNNIRLTRPRPISKYVKWVEQSNDQSQTEQTKKDLIDTIIMCRLRTLPGLDYSQIQDYMKENELDQFKK